MPSIVQLLHFVGGGYFLWYAFQVYAGHETPPRWLVSLMLVAAALDAFLDSLR